MYIGTAIFSQIKDLHAKFHQETARILSLALSGRKDEAERMIARDSEYKKLSEKLVGLLAELKNRRAEKAALPASV